ncbi:hypothetical protein L6452_32695 [Arctium lappa]|uniref:Uncharacterized protein n=1 Tax=Arctium lappa TaxID=4217 RepID=A0ACB8Z575_ARCLA|nr:hypothetical protein L6452_32695 [Arctium lappa]
MQPADVVRATEFNSFEAEVLQALSDLTKVVQTSCKAQASVSKPRHDHDSYHDHEGEMREKQNVDDDVIVVESEENVERENVDHGYVMSDQGECREIVLYVNPEVEPRVAKPKVATRAEILEITGMNDVDIIDLSSDDEEEANEKYEKFWKVKEEKKENLMDVSDAKNEGDDDIPADEANVLDTLLETPEDIQLSPVHNDVPESSYEELSQPSKNSTFLKPLNPDHNVQSVQDMLNERVVENPDEEVVHAPIMSEQGEAEAPLVPSEAEIRHMRHALRVPFLEEQMKRIIVHRRDLSECRFTEADFCFLSVDDLEYLYHHFKNMVIRRENIIFALESIKRFMRRHILYTCCYDFQLGIETNQKKVNMIKPNLTLSDIDNYDLFIVLEEPELGVVYKNSENEKKFFRVSEISKFSDGTLKVIRLQLDSRYKESERRRQLGEEHLPRRVKLVMLRILEVVDDRIEFRRGIRRFESFFWG